MNPQDVGLSCQKLRNYVRIC